MDGTILTSIAAAERVWSAWARRHGIDPAALLPTIHGVRAEDTIARQALAGMDVQQEARAVTEAELEDMTGVDAISGAGAFLRALPPGQWAVVTSAPRELARRRIEAAGLPMPQVLVAAEDVAAGKPSPEGYLLASSLLGVVASECLVFEDADAGVRAAEAAGASVCVVTAAHTHSPEHLAYARIRDYADLTLHVESGGRLVLNLA